MKSFYVYILKCSNGKFYTGHTDNIEKRIEEHIEGLCSYTSNKLPIKLVFLEDFGSRYEALAAERKIKKWTHRKKEILIQEGWEALQHYSSKEKRNMHSTRHKSLTQHERID